MFRRIAVVVSLLPLAGALQGAPLEPSCETMNEMNRLIANESVGIPTHLVQGNWVMDTPVAGAAFCIAQAKTKENGRANLTCSWTTTGEVAARAALQDTLSTLLSCRSTQRNRSLPETMAGKADRTAMTNDDNGNEAWIVEAMPFPHKPGKWDLVVTATVRDVAK